MNTQLPNCIPATLHCTPIEPCPTINPPCHGGQQQGQGAQAVTTLFTLFGCPTHVHATICPQLTPLCPPPQQAGGAQHVPFGPGPVHLLPTVVCPTFDCPQQQVANWPTPQTRCFICGPTVGCPQPAAAAVNTHLPQCQPNTLLCILTVNQGPCHTQNIPQQGGLGGCLPWTIGPVRTPMCPQW